MSLDLNYDYKQVQDKVSATKAYTNLKSQYSASQKKLEKVLIVKMRMFLKVLTKLKNKQNVTKNKSKVNLNNY
jgi:hypothetical protein